MVEAGLSPAEVIAAAPFLSALVTASSLSPQPQLLDPRPPRSLNLFPTTAIDP